jgi:hypothetical protein
MEIDMRHIDVSETIARAVAVMRQMHRLGLKPLRGARCGWDFRRNRPPEAKISELIRQQFECEPAAFVGCTLGFLWGVTGANPKQSIEQAAAMLEYRPVAICALLWRNDNGRCNWAEQASALERYRDMSDEQIVTEVHALAVERKINSPSKENYPLLQLTPPPTRSDAIAQLKANLMAELEAKMAAKATKVLEAA